MSNLISKSLGRLIGQQHNPAGQPPLGSIPTGPLVAPAQPVGGRFGVLGVQGPAQSGVGQSPNTEPRKKSDDRFRSFAERYVLTRSHLWPEDPEEWQKAMYAAVLDARVAYNTIKKVGFNAEHDGQ